MTREISVIICTLNRFNYLEKSLFSLQRQTFGKQNFEVIIVDGGSTDFTTGIIDKYSSVLLIHFVFAPGTGLSESRNIGIKQASGNIIAFIDDDAAADPDWLDQIHKSFQKKELGICACGGRSLLLWETVSPQWLDDNMFRYLGQLDYGHKYFFMDETDKNPIGLNMAIKKEIFNDIGYFNTHLGRNKGTLLSNEEVEFFQKMREKKYIILYNPQMLVYHIVSQDRTTKKYFYRRYYWQGRSDAVMNAVGNFSLKSFVFGAWRVMKRTGRLLRVFFSPLSDAREKKMVACRCDLMYNLGYLREQV